MESTPLRIVRLEAANVKRLVAVEITPDGNLVVIGGKNGAGKTSVLDSIAYALGGKDLVCERPLRDGAEHGHVEIDLGDLVVRRTFTPTGGGQLTVANKEGAVYKSPQAMLDKLVGRLSFDPLDFERMEPKRQLETLRALVGIDFSAIDAERARLYDDRTTINRTTKQIEARLATMPEHPDASAEEVSVAALMGELDAAQETYDAASGAEEVAVKWTSDIATHERRVANAEQYLTDLERQVVKAREAITQERGLLADQRAGAAKATDVASAARAAVIDSAPIRAQIASADATNAKVRANRRRADEAGKLEESRAQGVALTKIIDAIDAKKAAVLAETKFPVDGLSFDESGVMLNGVPFAQSSSAERLRVSVGMGLAMNPRLRVLLIRDGSLLDHDSLALVAEMAMQADAQVWLEKVSDDGVGCQVVIEDGAVRGAESDDAANVAAGRR